jgi:hypothetical protein
MTATEARHFLETCNDAIELGMTAELARRIVQANMIVAGDLAAKRESQIAASRAAFAARRAA